MVVDQELVMDTVQQEEYEDSGHFVDSYLTGAGDVLKVCPHQVPRRGRGSSSSSEGTDAPAGSIENRRYSRQSPARALNRM